MNCASPMLNTIYLYIYIVNNIPFIVIIYIALHLLSAYRDKFQPVDRIVRFCCTLFCDIRSILFTF